jgi:hypothetical protein
MYKKIKATYNLDQMEYITFRGPVLGFWTDNKMEKKDIIGN